ncbi:MAG TPA: VOC family protein [Myxococcota bacterium]|nr:VOC family protein [Myxococcota bacterium]
MSRIFGPVRQNGYVVRDVEAAMRHWTQVLGVGPFFYFERVPIEDFHYQGSPSPLAVSIALANSGALQIELIQQRNDAPSTYRDFLRAGHEGLQHVAYWTKAFDQDLERVLKLGYEVAQSGRVGGPNGRFVYLRTEGHPGTMVELSEVSGAKGRFFEHIAEAARIWEGSQPIRRM